MRVERVGGHIAHIAHIALQRVAQLCVFGQGTCGKGAVPERGACNDLYAFGRASAWSVPSKGRPPCRELLAVVQGPQALRHGDRLVGPELSLLAHRVLDTLRRHFHEDAALQHRARVRVEDLVKRASAPLKPFEHEVRRANLRHVVQVVVEFRQVLHRDDPERLRRHLHVVVATFDGGWQVGRQCFSVSTPPPWAPMLLLLI